MLTIFVPALEMYDEKSREFVETEGQSLSLEHSLLSISKWEAKWKKPFLSQDINTTTKEEILDYIKCMTLNEHIDPNVYLALTKENVNDIKNYIKDPHSATTIYNNKSNGPGGKKETITSELIYYWMLSLEIPFECQYWHLNRLLMLIDVCSIKNSPDKKMSKNEAMAQQKQLNAMRRAKLGSKG